MYYDNYKNLGKTLERIINPPYYKQLQMLSNPPWLKEMERLAKTMNANYSGFVVPKDSFSKALQSIPVITPQVNAEKIEKALRPFYGNESLVKKIDISLIAPGIAESLTKASSAAATIAASQSSIDKLSQGLSRSIPNIFGNYSFDSIMDKIVVQTPMISESFEDDDEPIEWEDIQFEDEGIIYRDVIVTKADVDGLMASEATNQSDNTETWKKKVAVILKVMGILLLLLGILDIPSNWTIQKSYQCIEEHIEVRDQSYYVFEDFANIYVNPETSSERLGTLAYGEIVTAIDENEFWIKMEKTGTDNKTITGWIQKTKIERYK